MFGWVRSWSLISTSFLDITKISEFDFSLSITRYFLTATFWRMPPTSRRRYTSPQTEDHVGFLALMSWSWRRGPEKYMDAPFTLWSDILTVNLNKMSLYVILTNLITKNEGEKTPSPYSIRLGLTPSIQVASVPIESTRNPTRDDMIAVFTSKDRRLNDTVKGAVRPFLKDLKSNRRHR